MKILEVNLAKGWRGGERQTLYNAQAFQRAGAQVCVLARRGQPLAQRAVEAGLAVAGVDSPAAGWGYLMTLARRFDLIHAQTAQALSACVFTRWFHGRPVVVTRRVAFPFGSSFTPLKYRLADRVVAISEAAAQAVRDVGVPDVKVISSAVNPTPLDAALAASWLQELGVPEGRRIIGSTSALTPDKDPLMQVEAMRLLRAQPGHEDVVMVHFGAGSMRPAVEQAIAAAGLQDCYFLAGFKSPVEDAYAVMDVFVMSSRQEGLGSSVLDAYAYGVPVASTDAGGLAEVLADGRGLASPVGDAAGLARHMAQLLDNPALRAQQVTRAETWVNTACSVDGTAAQYMALFEEMLGAKA